jgi:hypothetical protein
MLIWPILDQWFWRRRFLNEPTPFLHFCYYLPFEEDLALYLNNLEFPLPKDDLCQLWLKLACWFWRRSRKVKVYKQTDDGQRAIRIAHLTFQLRWAKNDKTVKLKIFVNFVNKLKMAELCPLWCKLLAGWCW